MSSYLDTRELDERLDELTALKDALTEANEALAELGESATDAERDTAQDAVDAADLNFTDGEKAEFAELESLRDEIGNEWAHGVTLIPCESFTEYAQELCEDCSDLPKDLPSYVVIDWEATADNIKADYSLATYQGQDYYFRA